MVTEEEREWWQTMVYWLCNLAIGLIGTALSVVMVCGMCYLAGCLFWCFKKGAGW